MSELQTEEAGAELPLETANVEAGTAESGADLAAASGDDHEQSTNNGIDQEAVNKAINKKHFQMKEAERKAEASDKRAQELEVRLQKLEQGDDPCSVANGDLLRVVIVNCCDITFVLQSL